MAVEVIANKEHLTLEGLRKIVAIRASINKGLTPKLNESFLHIVPVPRPTVENQKKRRNPYWLAGFTEGEGCFLIRIQNSSVYKLGSQIKLVFTLIQHSRDAALVKSFVEYFGCGNYYKRLNGLSCAFIVTKLDDMTEKVIPLYANYSLLGSKKQDYLDFKRVAELMNDKGSFNPSPQPTQPSLPPSL